MLFEHCITTIQVGTVGSSPASSQVSASVVTVPPAVVLRVENQRLHGLVGIDPGAKAESSAREGLQGSASFAQ